MYNLYPLGRRILFYPQVFAKENSRAILDYFDVFSRTDVGLDRTFRLISLPTDHATNYTVEVIAVNTAGRCARSTAFFVTDYTPPLEGHVAIDAGNFKVRRRSVVRKFGRSSVFVIGSLLNWNETEIINCRF